MKYKDEEIDPEAFLIAMGVTLKNTFEELVGDEFDWAILMSTKDGTNITHQVSNQDHNSDLTCKAMAAWLRAHADIIEAGLSISRCVGPMQ